MDKLELIRQACIKANPIGSGGFKYRPIRLADVLLAIDGTTQGQLIAIRPNGDMYRSDIQNTKWHWNLRNDDLSQQSNECIEFLYDLLKPTSQ
jgi:hypothetical protein